MGVLPSPSVPQFPQWPTKDKLPPPPPGLSACHSKREGAGQTKLRPGPSTPHVAPPEACSEHPPPNWKRSHISNSMPAAQRASLEHEFGRPVGGCVGGSYRPQGTCLSPASAPQIQTTNPQTGAPEVTQPCFQLHSGHQKLLFKLLLFPLRTGRASLTEGHSHVTAPGRVAMAMAPGDAVGRMAV